MQSHSWDQSKRGYLQCRFAFLFHITLQPTAVSICSMSFISFVLKPSVALVRCNEYIFIRLLFNLTAVDINYWSQEIVIYIRYSTRVMLLDSQMISGKKEDSSEACQKEVFPYSSEIKWQSYRFVRQASLLMRSGNIWFSLFHSTSKPEAVGCCSALLLCGLLFRIKLYFQKQKLF